jgi:glycosyltransferase involved in cell wall biosynthesis
VPFTEDIVPLILESDFIIQPSLFESFGVVIIEAMACEKVVLATDIGGPKDIITHEVDGYLISPQYPEKYANVINELVNNPNKYYDIAKKARKKVIDNFRNELIADKFIRIINTIN